MKYLGPGAALAIIFAIIILIFANRKSDSDSDVTFTYTTTTVNEEPADDSSNSSDVDSTEEVEDVEPIYYRIEAMYVEYSLSNEIGHDYELVPNRYLLLSNDSIVTCTLKEYMKFHVKDSISL